MSLEPSALDGYIVIDCGAGSAAGPAVSVAVQQLLADGWRRALELDGLSVFIGPDSRLKAVQVHRRHILIGDWRGDGVFLSSLVGGHRSAYGLAQAVVSQGWGRYVLAWRDDGGDLRLLRDPSGALDCICWRTQGASFASAHPPEALNVVMPVALAIDWESLGEISGAVGLASDRLALTGLTAVTPGSLARVGPEPMEESVWDPVRFASVRVWDERPDALVDLVDRVVTTLVAEHDQILTEVSGGLDSAIVSASVVAVGAGSKSRFMTFFDDQAEGDERQFARSAARRYDIELEEIHKPLAPLTRRQFEPLGEGVRPGLHGTDMAYDADTAARARAIGASGLLTGQGGDAVFFQSPDPLVFADRVRREGVMALDPAHLGAVARWTRHSAWTVARHSVFPSKQRPSKGRRHRWLAQADSLAPAKARQVQQLANCQTFWGDCLRARSARLLHPLLTQPVMEHCLAIPTDRLTLGARDRGLARKAFAARLPELILDRRDKGDLSRFYAMSVRRSAEVLTEMLVKGRLAEEGLIDPDVIEAGLRDAQLIRDAATNRFLILAVLETWVRNWEARIARVRIAQISGEPGQDP